MTLGRGQLVLLQREKGQSFLGEGEVGLAPPVARCGADKRLGNLVGLLVIPTRLLYRIPLFGRQGLGQDAEVHSRRAGLEHEHVSALNVDGEGILMRSEFRQIARDFFQAQQAPE
jgi:hypothetical protein